METLEPKLESLLMSKAFEALNAEERLFVSAFLTEEKYNAYHLILKHTFIGVQESDDALQPAAGIAEQLKAHFVAKRKPSLRLQLSIKHFSIAASLLIAVSLGVVLFKAKRQDKAPVTKTQAKLHPNTALPEPAEKSSAVLEKPLKQKMVSNLKPARKLKKSRQIKPVETTDSMVTVPEEFYGLHLQDPLLGIEIDATDQLLGLQLIQTGNQP
jgi:hypothetical protein